MFFLISLVLSLSSLFLNNDTAEIVFAGDAMQHKAQIDAAKKSDDIYTYDECFEAIAQYVQNADYAVVNLETPLGGTPYSGYPMFCSPDSYSLALKNAGFDLLLTANNHSLDKRDKGAKRTLDILDKQDIDHIGTYRNEVERNNVLPFIKNINGYKIAFLNYTYGTNGIAIQKDIIVDYIDKLKIKKDVENARNSGAEIIAVAIHWGTEYILLPNATQKALADYLTNLGVDLIIGGHPHVIQPMEIRESQNTPDRHVVAYSTGNLVSNMSLRRTDGGIMIAMKLHKIQNYTRPLNVRYLLTWIAPKRNDGKRDFTIYPAATTEFIGWDFAEQKRQLFINDSRSLFEKHNKGEITEMYIDTVRVIQ